MNSIDLKTYLPLGIAILGVAVTWGIFSAKLANGEQRMTAIETHQQKLDDRFTDIQVSLGKLQSDVSFIKVQVQ